ncbi:MAG TPA: hypothetical protein VG672_01275 [Bryobacteraceae bacterium]|jgi:hypothetical protein|nr:hypothetical protein [Bryobacteraceae bacterium]
MFRFISLAAQADQRVAPPAGARGSVPVAVRGVALALILLPRYIDATLFRP